MDEGEAQAAAEWVGIEEAARRTGAQKDTLRKRAQRGAEGTRKGEDGRWEFLIPVDVEDSDVLEVITNALPVQDTGASVAGEAPDALRWLVAAQRDEIEHLREQVDRKDRHIERLMDRLPELPPSEAQDQEWKSWWRKILSR